MGNPNRQPIPKDLINFAYAPSLMFMVVTGNFELRSEAEMNSIGVKTKMTKKEGRKLC